MTGTYLFTQTPIVAFTPHCRVASVLGPSERKGQAQRPRALRRRIIVVLGRQTRDRRRQALQVTPSCAWGLGLGWWGALTCLIFVGGFFWWGTRGMVRVDPISRRLQGATPASLVATELEPIQLNHAHKSR